MSSGEVKKTDLEHSEMFWLSAHPVFLLTTTMTHWLRSIVGYYTGVFLFVCVLRQGLGM